MLKMTSIRYELKPGTKTVWVETSKADETITEDVYQNIIDACGWFRRLGGSEWLERNYTPKGYKVCRLISKSPCRTKKTVRIFDWNSEK